MLKKIIEFFKKRKAIEEKSNEALRRYISACSVQLTKKLKEQ